jgi:hypothetical protein
VRRPLAVTLGLVALLGPAACGSDESPDSRAVTEAVEEQLAYLEPESSLVVALDLRYQEENWERLRALVDRLLSEARDVAGEGDVPANTEEALAQSLRSFSSLDFEDDVRPLLDGHLVVALTVEPGTEPGSDVPDTRVIVVYRTAEGELRPVVEKTLDGTPLRPLHGRDDVLVTEDGWALVGDDTLVAADGVEALRAALERAEADRGFPPELLRAAERGTGLDDPLLLATGTPDLARNFVASQNLDRALAEVPYLAAVERIDLALDVGEDAVEARGQVVTTGAELSEDELPLGPAGEVELPRAEGAIAGGSRDQSRITTFAAGVVRSAFADSDFVAAVEETERELGIRFEEEVLRQFDCPSVSVFAPEPDAPLGTAGRFSARSCVRDPERMRELLPKLAPRLPRILRAMRGLGGEGLLGLLLLAPDAPLSPGVPLAQIGVDPLGAGAPEEQLYEATGLRDAAPGEPVFPGPDRVVFGMIGEDFVVGSDRQAAREAAALETEPFGKEAASALRVAPRTLAGLVGSAEAAQVLERTFGEIEISFAAEPNATDAYARVPLAD